MGAIPTSDPDHPWAYENADWGTFNVQAGRVIGTTGSGGVMFQNSKVRPTDVTDGTSNTVAVGECKFDWDVATGTGHKAAIWPGMRGDTGGSVYWSDVMWYFDETTAQVNGTASQAVSSYHQSGANCGFADGSVRFLKNGGNVQGLMWAGGRHDGKIVPFD